LVFRRAHAIDEEDDDIEPICPAFASRMVFFSVK
jgi:hypothetical protein